MINVNTITIAQFQAQFPAGVGGYLYLPTWTSTANYIIGDIVYYNNAFYQAIANNVNQIPPNITYWTLYTANVYSYISDNDINTAFLIAQGFFPNTIFNSDTDPFIVYTYCLLVAHVILYFIKPQENAYLGQTSSSLGTITNQSVGNVSLTRAVPKDITDNVFYTGLNTTLYGQQYLLIIQPRTSFRMIYSFGGIPN